MKNVCLILISIVFFHGCQNKRDNEEGIIRVTLESYSPGEIRGPRWSPKGEKLKLIRSSEGLKAELFLGPKGEPPINILMSSSDGASDYDQLQLDLDRNGKFGEDEDTLLTCSPNERRGKT